MQHIADGLGARLVEVEGKPLGRRACTIQMDGWNIVVMSPLVWKSSATVPPSMRAYARIELVI